VAIIPVAACLQTSLAQFPWPKVPKPTAQRVIVRDLLQPLPADLGAVVGLLRTKLRAAGYPPPPVVGAGCNGFAMILEGERIRPNGRRIGFQKWGQTSSVDAGEILRRLLTAAPGMYRIIVVVVSTEQPVTMPSKISAEALDSLVATGTSLLPSQMARLPFVEGYEVRALVYEFVKHSQGAEQVAPNGRVSVVAHLQQAGLLPAQ